MASASEGSPIVMSRFERHVFVCVNARPAAGRPSCGARNSADVLSALQRAVAAHPVLCARVAVTGCGCLGPCFDGPNLVIYPEGIWYAEVTVDDVAEILASHLEAGVAVARLLYQWPDE